MSDSHPLYSEIEQITMQQVSCNFSSFVLICDVGRFCILSYCALLCRHSSDCIRILSFQLRYALEGVEQNTWTLFAEDGEMKMFKVGFPFLVYCSCVKSLRVYIVVLQREVEMDGLPVDPLKALHNVKVSCAFVCRSLPL